MCFKLSSKAENLYNDYATLVGRLLLGGLFAFAGYGKLVGFQGTAGWMASAGLPLPEFLLILTIILEIGGGLALIAGWHTKCVSFLFAGFVVLATAVFHSDFSVDGQQMLFFKNLMILGGLLAYSAFGPGRLTINNCVGSKKKKSKKK